MITFTGVHIDAGDKEVLRLFSNFVLTTFCCAQKVNGANIIINFVNPNTLKGQNRLELEGFKAWMQQSDKNKYRFTITINSKMIYNVTNQLQRLKPALLCLAHELVHVKQYLNGEMCDYTNGDVWFKHKRYTDCDDGIGYWFSPFELEAYSYENALFQVFKLNLLQEAQLTS